MTTMAALNPDTRPRERLLAHGPTQLADQELLAIVLGSGTAGRSAIEVAGGVATFSGVSLNKVGSGYTLNVTSNTLTTTTSGAILVMPGSATQLVITSEPPSTVAAGGGFGFTIAAEDAMEIIVILVAFTVSIMARELGVVVQQTTT